MRYLKKWGLFRFGGKRWRNSCILAATILKRRGYGRCIIYRAGGGSDRILGFRGGDGCTFRPGWRGGRGKDGAAIRDRVRGDRAGSDWCGGVVVGVRGNRVGVVGRVVAEGGTCAGVNEDVVVVDRVGDGGVVDCAGLSENNN